MGPMQNPSCNICSECGLLFPTAEEQKSHNEKEHDCKIINLDNMQKEDVKVDEEDNPEPRHKNLSTTSEFYEIREFPENNLPDDEDLDKVYGTRPKLDQQGITMKGKSQTFKDALTILKGKLQKGKIVKDSKGRQITILNELDGGALEVEVQTLSKKTNEKRGRVKLNMYRPHT